MLSSGLPLVPDVQGVYAVLRVGKGTPRFLRSDPSGHFKGQNPTVAPSESQRRWVSKIEVLYIGKAAGKRGLRLPVRDLLRFASGKPVGHWRGRLLWQVSGWKSFLVAWLPTPRQDPRVVERQLLANFQSTHGRLPFANLTR
jgi:hypothetical protein